MCSDKLRLIKIVVSKIVVVASFPTKITRYNHVIPFICMQRSLLIWS